MMRPVTSVGKPSSDMRSARKVPKRPFPVLRIATPRRRDATDARMESMDLHQEAPPATGAPLMPDARGAAPVRFRESGGDRRFPPVLLRRGGFWENIPEGHPPMVELDRIDTRILAALQSDASLAIAELAEAVGLSSNACWRRVKRLEESGVIRRRVALLDPVKLG